MAIEGHGRPRRAPGSWGEVWYEVNGNKIVALVKVRRIDGGIQKVKRSAASRQAAHDAVIAAAKIVAGTSDADGLNRRSTIAALIDNWHNREVSIEENRTQTMDEQYRLAKAVIIPAMGAVAIGEVTVPMCEHAYESWLEPRRARDRNGREYGEPRVMSSQARNALGVLKKVLDRAVSLGLRDDNPARKVKPRKRRKKEIIALDASHVQQLLRAVTAYNERPDRHGPKQKYLEFALSIMAGTGGRIGEALAIRTLEDIDLIPVPCVIRITGTIVDLKGSGAVRQDFPKSDQSIRSVQAPMWLDALIRAWIADPEHADQDLLFQTSSGRPVSPDRVQLNLRTVREWAGLPESIVSHVMRKSVATAITSEHGTDAGMWTLGHADTRVLEGHYDKRGTVTYDVTKTLEAFDPASFLAAPAGQPAAPAEDSVRATVVRVLESIGMLNDMVPVEAREAIIGAQMQKIREEQSAL